MLTVGSLFAGIGGLELGLERAGMKVLWQVENNEYASRVLAKHWPDVARYGDVRDVGAHNLAPVDLICGGFPCQPFSIAGLRLGSADERWLWPELARIVREIAPRWVVAENVRGLLSNDSGREFGHILGDLAALGFDAEWGVLSATSVGAPHRRERVFIVAHATQLQRNGSNIYARGGCESPRRVSQPRDGSTTSHVPDAGSVRYGAPDSQVSAGRNTIEPSDWWRAEPDVGRVADGVPSRVDRLRCLGNAVVPAVAEYVGRRIVEAEAVS